MKFAKPRVLTENIYPDLDVSQPALFKKLSSIIYPEKNSHMDLYYDSTIQFIKEKLRNRSKKINSEIDVNNVIIENKLPFIIVCFNDNKGYHQSFNALVDTGAANSLMHISVAEILGIKYEPLNLKLCTASGEDSDSIVGRAYI